MSSITPVINALLEKRALAIKMGRDALDEGEAGTRSAADVDTVWAKTMTDATAIDARIVEVRNLLLAETVAEEARTLAGGIATKTADAAPTLSHRAQDNALLRAIAKGEHRSGVEMQNRSIGVALPGGTTGGSLVPQGFVEQVIAFIRDTSVIRPYVRTLPTTAGNPLVMPKQTGSAAATWVAEFATIPNSEPTFAQVTFSAFKAGVMSYISNELIEDAFFDISGFVAADVALSIALLEDTAFLVGTGTGQPLGMVANVTLGPIAASATAVTFDELIDLQHSVLPQYRPRAHFLMNDATIAKVRKLKDLQGDYLWQASQQDGVPDKLLNTPVLSDPNMPLATAGLRSILYGDFMSAYMVREVQGVEVALSTDFRFDTDAVAIRVRHRVDGRVLDANAVKALRQL